jgi:TonB family protein
VNISKHIRPMQKTTVYYLLFLLFLCKTTLLNAQAEKVAEFPGGNVAYNKYLQYWLQERPTSCSQNEGESIIKVDVSNTGEFSNAQLLKSSGCSSFDSIFMVAVKAMPRWSPHTIEGKPVESYVTMNVFLRQKTILDRKFENLRVAFEIPIGYRLMYGALNKKIDLKSFGGVALKFEGLKWGIDLEIFTGGGKVLTSFYNNQYLWEKDRKIWLSNIQFGAKRKLIDIINGSMWAVGGIGITEFNHANPTRGNPSEYSKLTSYSPYFGADIRRFLPFYSFKMSPIERGMFYGQFSFRTFPWAIQKIERGGIFSFNVSVGLMVAQNFNKY